MAVAWFSVEIAEYEIILFQIRRQVPCYWSVATPIFRVKRASNSQYTVDLYCAKGSKKKIQYFG